mgnify:CR=1 FL=1
MTHKVFVSYHHSNDQKKAEYLRTTYGDNNTLLDRSLDESYENMTDDEILAAIRQEHLKDSTVTIVLIGSETANRKWIDWEIYSSLRPYGSRSRNGLLGIYLPTAGETPARLQDNIDSGYAVTMEWENISWQLESKIDEAFNNMDEQRIQEMIKFYNEREIQTFIAVPPSRASTIIPYVNTRLLVIKQGQQSFVEGFKDEQL